MFGSNPLVFQQELESVSLKKEKSIPKKVHHIYWKTREGFFIFKTKNSCSSYLVSTNIRTFFVLFCRSEIETAVTKEVFFCKLTSETLEPKVFDCLSVAVRLCCFCYVLQKEKKFNPRKHFTFFAAESDILGEENDKKSEVLFIQFSCFM